MNGRQINFFLSAVDQNRLLEHIGSRAEFSLIKRNDYEEYHISRKSIDDADWAVAYLCEVNEAPEIVDLLAADGGDSSRLNVIEFMRCFERGGTIQRGRFWYSKNYLADGMMVPKAEHFCEWANRIFVSSKKLLRPDGSGNWMGADAKMLVDAGAVKFIS